MKRKEHIEQKLNEKEKVDFDEIQKDDKRSLDRLKREEEDNLYEVDKSIKRYLQNHTLTLGSEFVALKEKKASIEQRIKLIDQIIEDHV